MTEEDKIVPLYHEMYEAAVQKERAVPLKHPMMFRHCAFT